MRYLEFGNVDGPSVWWATLERLGFLYLLMYGMVPLVLFLNCLYVVFLWVHLEGGLGFESLNFKPIEALMGIVFLEIDEELLIVVKMGQVRSRTYL